MGVWKLRSYAQQGRKRFDSMILFGFPGREYFTMHRGTSFLYFVYIHIALFMSTIVWFSG